MKHPPSRRVSLCVPAAALGSSDHMFRWVRTLQRLLLLPFFLGQIQKGISAVKRTPQAMTVSSAPFLCRSRISMRVAGAFRVLLSQLCLCSPPVSHPTLDSFPGASSWPARVRGACSLPHLHTLQAVVLTEPWKAFLPHPTPKCPPSSLTSVCPKTGKAWFWGGDGKVNCRESCSLRACSVVLLAAAHC